MHKINNLANLGSVYFVLSVYQIVLVLNKKVTDIFLVSLKKPKLLKVVQAAMIIIGQTARQSPEFLYGQCVLR